MTWEDVSYHIVDVKTPKIDRLLSTLRESFVNGGAICACFEADDTAAFRDALFNDTRNASRLYDAFLRSPSIAQALPELEIEPSLSPRPEFQHTVALGMEGELTHTILAGGAYDRFPGHMDEARQIRRDFMEEIVSGRWLAHNVAISYTPWSKWFFGIAWDSTFILCDREGHRFWLLCITDTD